MNTFKFIEWNDKRAKYLSWRTEFDGKVKSDVFHIGPGEGSYGTGWTALVLGNFSNWDEMKKQIFIRKFDAGDWYVAERFFKESFPSPLIRTGKPDCFVTFLDDAFNTWINDLVLRETE